MSDNLYEEAANAVLKAVNAMGGDPQDFINKVTLDHRTLQQASARLFVGCFKAWADMDQCSMYDDRNEATVKLSVKIVEIEQLNLPFI